MTNLERLKLELSHKNYYTDEEYSIFLTENNLIPTNIYNKEVDRKGLLETVISILQTLSNDVDLMRKIDSKDIQSVDQAMKYLRLRIYDIKQEILTIPTTEIHTNIKPLFTRRR